jgi:sporulation protein YlmC with PRC-barrel domain
VTRISKLNGKKVITLNAFAVGEIEEAEVNVGNWQVTHVYVSLTNEASKELGFKKPVLGTITICLPVSFIQAVGDVVTLNKSLPELKDTRECK